MGGGALRGDKPSRTGFVDLFRNRIFVVLYVAESQSILGDQLARVALSVLVFDETRSATATAATYATTLLPAIFGGVFLARIGDLLPRRVVLVGCDVVRAAVFVVMALPAVPLPAMIALLIVAVCLGPVFSAAEVSVLAGVLDSEQFRSAAAVRMMTMQAAQVVGFAVGGVLVAALGARNALFVDATTFAFSALLIGLGLRGAVALKAGRSNEKQTTAGERSAFTGLWRDRRLRSLIALSCLVGFFVVPEGLAVPYVSQAGGSTSQVGLLLAAGALGGAIGAFALVRLVPPDRRGIVANWMAVGCGLPLIVSGITPHWPLAAACWLLSGLLAAYLVEVTTVVVQAIPESLRSRLIGVFGAALIAAQGLGMILFGLLTRILSTAHAIGLAGLLGSVCAFGLVAGPLQSRVRPAAADEGADTTAIHAGDVLRDRVRDVS